MTETAETPPLANPPPPTKVSPKVVMSAVLGFLAPALLAVIVYLQTPAGQSSFGGLSPVLVILLGGLLTSAATFLGGYLKRDPLRELGARAQF